MNIVRNQIKAGSLHFKPMYLMCSVSAGNRSAASFSKIRVSMSNAFIPLKYLGIKSVAIATSTRNAASSISLEMFSSSSGSGFMFRIKNLTNDSM